MKYRIIFFAYLIIYVTGVKAQTLQQLTIAGDSCMKAYDYHNAIGYYEKASALNASYKLRMKLAECYYQRTNYRKSNEMLEAIPQDSLTHDALRMFYYGAGAVKDIKKQLFLGDLIAIRYPMDSKILADVMRLYTSDAVDKPIFALKRGQLYVDRDSTNNEVNRALGEAYFMTGFYEKCIETYARVHQQGDTTYNSLYYTGGAFEYLNHNDSAAVYFSKAIAREPKLAVGFYRLGMVENKLGEYDKAVEHLKTATKLYEPNKTIMFVIYRAMGDAKQSVNDLRLATLYWSYALAYQEDKELQTKVDDMKKKLKK